MLSWQWSSCLISETLVNGESEDSCALVSYLTTLKLVQTEVSGYLFYNHHWLATCLYKKRSHPAPPTSQSVGDVTTRIWPGHWWTPENSGPIRHSWLYQDPPTHSSPHPPCLVTWRDSVLVFCLHNVHRSHITSFTIPLRMTPTPPWQKMWYFSETHSGCLPIIYLSLISYCFTQIYFFLKLLYFGIFFLLFIATSSQE